MKKINLVAFLLFLFTGAFAQNVVLEGYVYEEDNRGYLNLVKVTILNNNSKAVVGTVYSNMEGLFTATLPAGGDYLLRAQKDLFKEKEITVSTRGVKTGAKVYAKVEMSRKPGYIFDVTMAEKRMKDEVVDAILGAKVEVFNNTKKEEVLVLENHPIPTFGVTFESGNHYTIMIRKKGYFTKRMEAYVDVEGCILCFDGVGDVRPGISDNLAHGHDMGTLVANVELQKLVLNESLTIDNIYYDYNSANIRKDAEEELDNVITLLKDNPQLIVELGSHTDSRGGNPYNLTLSQKRAESAVEYITETGIIEQMRIKAKGYGETQLTNKCRDGVKCSNAEHEKNRRTELKVVGILAGNTLSKSLAEIIKEEEFDRMLADVQGSDQIKIAPGEALPDEIKNQSANANKPKAKKTTATSPSIASASPSPNTATSKISSNPPVATPPKVKPSKPVDTFRQPAKEALPSRPKFESVASAPKPKASTNTRTSTRPNMPTVQPGNTTAKPAYPSGRADSKIVDEYQITRRVAVRGPKMLTRNYSGYRVEFYSSPFELPSSHKIFSQHGNITKEEKKDGTYAYLLGNFNDPKDAQRFLINVIQARYNTAKVIHYRNGNRLAR